MLGSHWQLHWSYIVGFIIMHACLIKESLIIDIMYGL